MRADAAVEGTLQLERASNPHRVPGRATLTHTITALGEGDLTRPENSALRATEGSRAHSIEDLAPTGKPRSVMGVTDGVGESTLELWVFSPQGKNDSVEYQNASRHGLDRTMSWESGSQGAIRQGTVARIIAQQEPLG